MVSHHQLFPSFECFYVSENENMYEVFNHAMTESESNIEELKILSAENHDLQQRQHVLTNEKKALSKRLKNVVQREAKNNLAMQKRLNRRTFFERHPKVPFTELKNRQSRIEAVSKFMRILMGIFTLYKPEDFWAISRRAWPNTSPDITMLSPALTWQFMCNVGISFTKMRIVRRFLNMSKLNVFSSENKVYALIVSAAHSTVTMTYNVLVKIKKIIKPKTIHCGQVTSLREVLTQRIRAQLKSGRFPQSLRILQLCIGFDKGGTTTKMGMMMGSVKNRNGPRGMSLLALYEGNESPEELTAAFGPLINEAQNIRCIEIDGRKIYVRFRFTGDLKCLKACLGLKGGGANHPCLFCLQKKGELFSGYDATTGEKREHYCYLRGPLPGQGHEGCLSWISPDQIVLPSLHLLMGVAEKIFDHFISRMIAKKIVKGLKDDTFAKLRMINEEVIEATEALENERESLQSWTSISDKLRCVVFPPLVTQYPDNVNRSTAREWNSEICGCSSCITKLTDIDIPQRHSSSPQSSAPDWIWSQSKNMWFHSLCLGLSEQEAIAAKQIPNYNPEIDKIEMLKQVQTELEWAKTRVKKAEDKLDAALSALNLPKAVTDDPIIDAFFRVFETFGAYRNLWFQRFNGNHIRLILKATEPTPKRSYTLQSKMEEQDELKAMFEDEQFVLGFEALKALGKIQCKNSL